VPRLFEWVMPPLVRTLCGPLPMCTRYRRPPPSHLRQVQSRKGPFFRPGAYRALIAPDELQHKALTIRNNIAFCGVTDGDATQSGSAPHRSGDQRGGHKPQFHGDDEGARGRLHPLHHAGKIQTRDEPQSVLQPAAKLPATIANRMQAAVV